MTNPNVLAADSTPPVHQVVPSYTSVPTELVLHCEQNSVRVFSDLFAGRVSAFGYRVNHASKTSRKPLEEKHYRRHLSEPDPKDWSLGVVPIGESNDCRFGAIDYDLPDLSDEQALAIVQRSAFAQLPLVWTFSKSRGLHGWLFLQVPQPAEAVRRVLHHWATTVFTWRPKDPDDKKTDKAGFFEVFPKQDQVAPTDVGNYIHLPWTGAGASPRYGFNAKGRVGFAAWLALGTSWRVPAEQFATWAAEAPVLRAPSVKETTAQADDAPDLAQAARLLGQFDESRWEGYDSWLQIGMALHAAFDGDDDALTLWDERSQGSTSYQPSACAEKWATFRADRADGLGFGSLVAWADEDRIGSLNQRYAFVLVGDKQAVLEEAESDFELLGIDAFKGWLANQAPIRRGRKELPLAVHWLQHPQRRSYRRIVFTPSGSARPDEYNIWRGFAVEPNAQASCARFLTHLRDNVARGSEEHYRWIVGWFAQLIQQPGVKLGTSLVLRGGQGVGKTIIGEVMRLLLARHYVKVAASRYVVGQFNSHLKHALLLHADEGFWAGDKQAEGVLKDLITSDSLRIEFKGKEAIAVTNYVRLFVTSNSDWVVPAAFDERRFAVFDVSEAQRQNHGYFGPLMKEMTEEGGAGALLHHLLQYDLASVNLRAIPTTSALQEQKAQSFDPETAWWVDVLQHGVLPGDSTASGRCSTVAIHGAYVRHAKLTGINRRQTQTRLGQFLRRMVPTVRKRETTVNGAREFLYEFPSLAECRKVFAERLRTGMAWDGEADATWGRWSPTHEREDPWDEPRAYG